jgi:hypothetical protein
MTILTTAKREAKGQQKSEPPPQEGPEIQFVSKDPKHTFN